MRFAFFMKKNKHTIQAEKYLKLLLDPKDYRIYYTDTLEYLFYDNRFESADYYISYLSSHIFNKPQLKQAKIAAINFHPGPPEYPGMGCYNFAIRDGVKKYGATCHFMAEKVDAGPIIAVERFNIFDNISVEILQQMTLNYLFSLFTKIMGILLSGGQLESNGEVWKREAYTREDLKELTHIRLPLDDDVEKDIGRQIQAAYYPYAQDPPYIKINGKKWRLEQYE